MNDKYLVILCVTLIALCVMLVQFNENIITAIVSGLFGVAVGKELK